MAKDEVAPKGVGPHEGRELELMLAGEKPLAMFGDAVGSAYEIPEIDFAPFVADGTFVRREEVYRPGGTGVPGRSVYFARAGEEWRIQTMHRITQSLVVHQESINPPLQREIVRLLEFGRSTGREREGHNG